MSMIGGAKTMYKIRLVKGCNKLVIKKKKSDVTNYVFVTSFVDRALFLALTSECIKIR